MTPWGRIGVWLLCMTAAGPALAATITIGSASVDRGDVDRAEICVGMVLGAGEVVAGTENEIALGTCATMVPQSCRANPAHGKEVRGAVLQGGESAFKALVINFSDLSPIPAGELYCCEFIARLVTPGECCELRVLKPGASDPSGVMIDAVAGPPGQLCLARDGIPSVATPTAIETSTPSRTFTPRPTFVPSATSVPGATAVPTATRRRTGSARTVTPLPARPSRTPGTNEGRTRKPTKTGRPTRTPLFANSGGESDDTCAISAAPKIGWAVWMPLLGMLALRCFSAGAWRRARRAPLRGK